MFSSFGILADDTPPVGLAAFAAAAIAKSDPIKTGVQGFTYDIRTAILPFMFIFNTELLLIGVDSVLYGVWIFLSALIAMFAFAALTQNYFFTKNKWFESILLGLAALTLLRPSLVGGWIGMSASPKQLIMVLGIAVVFLVYGYQRLRMRKFPV